VIACLFIGLTRFLVGGQGLWLGCAPTARQRIYFANHTSHLDTVLMWAALPPALRARTHPVAAADYWGRGALRRHVALEVLNAVLIDRSGSVQTPGGPLAPLQAALEAGDSLILFPEGTRGTECIPAAFKSGLYHLARDFPDVELIPVYLDNLRRALPKGSLLPVPISCAVRFGAALPRVAGEDKADFLTRARDAVIALS